MSSMNRKGCRWGTISSIFFLRIRSASIQAPIDMDDRAADVRTGRGQKTDHLRNLLGSPHAAQGNPRQYPRLNLLRQPGRHLRRDESGGDGTDQDVAPLKLLRERLRQGVQRRLLHGIGDLAAVPRVSDDARDVDDPAAPGAEHEMAYDALRAVPRAPQSRAPRLELLDHQPR